MLQQLGVTISARLSFWDLIFFVNWVVKYSHMNVTPDLFGPLKWIVAAFDLGLWVLTWELNLQIRSKSNCLYVDIMELSWTFTQKYKP